MANAVRSEGGGKEAQLPTWSGFAAVWAATMLREGGVDVGAAEEDAVRGVVNAECSRGGCRG